MKAVLAAFSQECDSCEWERIMQQNPHFCVHAENRGFVHQRKKQKIEHTSFAALHCKEIGYRKQELVPAEPSLFTQQQVHQSIHVPHAFSPCLNISPPSEACTFVSLL